MGLPAFWLVVCLPTGRGLVLTGLPARPNLLERNHTAGWNQWWNLAQPMLAMAVIYLPFFPHSRRWKDIVYRFHLWLHFYCLLLSCFTFVVLRRKSPGRFQSCVS